MEAPREPEDVETLIADRVAVYEQTVRAQKQSWQQMARGMFFAHHEPLTTIVNTIIDQADSEHFIQDMAREYAEAIQENNVELIKQNPLVQARSIQLYELTRYAITRGYFFQYGDTGNLLLELNYAFEINE